MINSYRTFSDTGKNLLSLRCFGQEGHGDLYWATDNVPLLPKNLTQAVAAGNSNLTIAEASGRDITINYYEFDDSNKTGVYLCRSLESGESFSVLTILG